MKPAKIEVINLGLNRNIKKRITTVRRDADKSLALPIFLFVSQPK
jgi:hypothetical protein